MTKTLTTDQLRDKFTELLNGGAWPTDLDAFMAAVKDHVEYIIDTRSPEGVDETCARLLKESQRNRGGAY